MSRRRWIADQVSGDRAVLLGAAAEHLARVLRARIGQEFEISTGDRVRLGRVVSVSGECVEFELGAEVPQTAAAPVALLLAIFKFDRMEWVLEKATELGVAEIVPVIARRTDAHLAAAAPKRVERWRRLVREASQQARRVAPPNICGPQPLNSALNLSADLRIVLAETEHTVTLKQALMPEDRQPTTENRQLAAALAIGPEGGWTAGELAAFSAAGWTAASLGDAILRAETAAIAALAITFAELRV